MAVSASMTSSCCSQLAALRGLHVAFPNTAAYNATEASYWTLQEADLVPSCIVKPTKSHDVVEIVKTIVAKDCRFAIKGRGHAPAAGFANIDHGVTIDMGDLAAVSVNRDHSVASVGAGASWLDVYSFLDPLGKTVAGGRNGDVGVGGLTTGGGISYFSPQVGWTCNTVRNFEVVLASGKLVNANQTSNSDLFRALKGGTNNFGVVTRIDFNTLPISQILGGTIANDISYRHEVFDAFTKIANATEYDIHTSIVTALSFSSSAKNWSLFSIPVYTKPVRNPPVYHELFSIPNITNSMHITKLSTYSNESIPPQNRQIFYAATYGASAKLLDRIFEISNSSFHDFSVADESLSWSLIIEPLPKVYVSHDAGNSVLGTSPADGNGVIVAYSASWTNEKVTEQVKQKFDQVMSSIDARVEQMGLKHQFIYANYAGANQRPFVSYGAANAGFLHRVAKKYDEHNVFQRLVPGGFKLGG